MAAALAVVALSCRDLPPVEERGSFTFAVFGDGPYEWTDNGRFKRLLEDVGRSDIAFLIHVGDILWYPCSDAALLGRRRALGSVGVPIVYTPGDNDWTDCHEHIAGGYEPLDRLAAVRRIFFADSSWSHAASLHPIAQSAEAGWSNYVENLRWEVGGLLFATLHVVGGDNGFRPFPGRGVADDSEATERTAAALAWMRETFALAGDRQARAVVLAMHADLGFEASNPPQVFVRLRDELAALAEAWGKPVLLIHGDSHEYRVDRPLVDRQVGDTISNVIRLETYGSPDIGWVRVVVDTAAAEPFSFEPRLLPRRMLFW